MEFVQKIFAADDAVISTMTNPARNFTGVKDIAGILTGAGFNVFDLIFALVGLAFFTNLVMAGWDYLLSSGDQKKISAATSRITNGLIGIIMAIAAFLVVRIITTLIGIPKIF